MTRYAIVPARGCYSSSSRNVRAIGLSATPEAAIKRAAAATREYRRSIPGYTSGGYRVVRTDATTLREAVWDFGHDLDREPSVE